MASAARATNLGFEPLISRGAFSGPVMSVTSKLVLQCLPYQDRLVGLVVKASASRAEDPGFESRLRRDSFGVESYR